MVAITFWLLPSEIRSSKGVGFALKNSASPQAPINHSRPLMTLLRQLRSQPSGAARTIPTTYGRMAHPREVRLLNGCSQTSVTPRSASVFLTYSAALLD